MCRPFFLLMTILAVSLYSQELRITEQSTVVFASIAESKQILGTTDDFVSRMSKFDRSARLKTSQPVSTEEYLQFVNSNIEAWSLSEIKMISGIVEDIKDKLDELTVPLPDKTIFIKTTGKEEGNAPYTRKNAIVIPKSELSKSDTEIKRIICHEIFHIMTRNNNSLKREMYKAIGFVQYEELVFPKMLKNRKITNPDAPMNDYAIRVKVKEKAEWVVPILFSKTDTYNPQMGEEFFNYLQFALLIVEPDKESKLFYNNEDLNVVSPNQITGFFEKTGKNTEYIIHPEEILADNFTLLVLETTDLPSVEVPISIKEILLSHSVQSTK